MNEVKSPKKPLIYYYMIVVLLVLLFNLLAMPWLAEHQIKEVDYNTFVSMTEKNEIGQVEIQQQSNRILFTSTDGKTIYKTAIVPDDGLVQRLLDAGGHAQLDDLAEKRFVEGQFVENLPQRFACPVGRPDEPGQGRIPFIERETFAGDIVCFVVDNPPVGRGAACHQGQCIGKQVVVPPPPVVRRPRFGAALCDKGIDPVVRQVEFAGRVFICCFLFHRQML